MYTQLAASITSAASAGSLYFHTLSKGDLAGSDVPLEDVVGSVVSSPMQPLGLDDWQALASSLDDLDRERARAQMGFFFPTLSEGVRQFERTSREVGELSEAPLRGLCERLLVRPIAPPFDSGGLLTVSAPAFVLSNQVRENTQALPRMVETWARATSLMTVDDPGDADLRRSLLGIELPHHNSPEVDGTSVDGFLACLRHAVYLPLTAGAVETASAVSHQHFALALETTAASGAITLVLAATVNLTDRLLEKRKSRGN